MIAQDFWQVHYQILLIILQKEFLECDSLKENLIKYKCFLECESVKENLIKYKCLFCNKDYSNKIDEELKKRIENTFKLSNNDINKFILLLKKGFILMSKWMIGKSLMKQHYLK